MVINIKAYIVHYSYNYVIEIRGEKRAAFPCNYEVSMTSIQNLR